MATVINKRDVALQAASPRTVSVNLGTNIVVNGSVSGNVTGTLNGTPVATVVEAALTGGSTDPFFSTSTSDPTGGVDGDAHFNSATQVMWVKVSGTWTKGGTVNASQIITGTLAAARIAAGSITSDKINVTTLSAIAANLGTVTAGNISGSSDINIAGTAKFSGTTPSGGVNYAVVCNESRDTPGGVLGNAGPGGFGVRGDAAGQASSSIGVSGSNTTGDGVRGTATSGVGVRAVASTGTALLVDGIMQITSSSAVTNLNADMVDGKHASSLCQIVPTNSGTCTVSGNGFNLNVTGTLASSVRTRGTSNTVFIENISDERLKQDIEDEQYGLDFINSLRPRSFRMKANPQLKAHGLIYQEVRELVNSDDSLACLNQDGETGAVDYNGIISPLIKAIQELSRQVEELKNGQKTTNSY